MNTNLAVSKIRSFFRQNKRLPSYREMCTIFGFASKKASFDLAKKLIQLGIVEKDATGRLIPKQLFPVLPVLGSIQAGFPTAAEQQLLDTLSIETYLVERPEQSYLLKVSGDSMVGAGINSGDMVVIEHGRKPYEGDIVVAHIDGEFTLKYFRQKDGKVCLVAANTKYPTLFPEENLTIFGIVVSVIRKYH